eukprot:RCo020836
MAFRSNLEKGWLSCRLHLSFFHGGWLSLLLLLGGTGMVTSNDAVDSDTARSKHFLSTLKCPEFSPLSGSLQKEARVYDRRADSGLCEGSGLWTKYTLADHFKIVKVLAELFQPKPGQLIFDWGSGCGHKLQGLHALTGACGLGIDISSIAVNHANNVSLARSGLLRFCAGDGTNLTWIPTATFQHALSYGAIYHLPENLQCLALKEMLRVVRPQGLVLNGFCYIRRSPKEVWRQCLQNMADITWSFLPHWGFTGIHKYSKHNYDLIIHKQAESTHPVFRRFKVNH